MGRQDAILGIDRGDKGSPPQSEDALSDALLKALETWPASGVPADFEGGLLAVANRQLLQVARHDRVRFNPAVRLLLEGEEHEPEAVDIPDARLKLMFVCAHPAIDERVRIPLGTSNNH